jgi:hypothetical protein
MRRLLVGVAVLRHVIHVLGSDAMKTNTLEEDLEFHIADALGDFPIKPPGRNDNNTVMQFHVAIARAVRDRLISRFDIAKKTAD